MRACVLTLSRLARVRVSAPTGQSKSKMHATLDDALEAANNTLNEKLKKKYVLQGK